MGGLFLQLPPGERKEALNLAAKASGVRSNLLEKDVWIVWTLETLFAAPFGEHLIFKGGTSLSKGYGIIKRFSEDVDITYDIREIIPDLVGEREDALPPNRSQEKKWTDAVRKRLAQWAATIVVPILEKALQRDGLASVCQLRVEDYKVFLDYEPVTAGSAYVAPSVILEFGARSTGEPWERRDVVCDAAAHLPALAFPAAAPRTMRAERTFWEKATAIHVYCLRRVSGAERFARHWHDLVRLDDAGCADKALRDRDLALKVARHKGWFFSHKDARGERIDYEAAVSGGLVLVPEGKALEAIAGDYANMAEGGLLLENPEPFGDIMGRCREMERKANGR